MNALASILAFSTVTYLRIPTKILDMLFRFRLIINSYSQQFYFIRKGNNFAVNIKSKGRYIFNSKNFWLQGISNKLKITQISL